MHNQSRHTIDTQMMYRAQQLVAGVTYSVDVQRLGTASVTLIHDNHVYKIAIRS